MKPSCLVIGGGLSGIFSAAFLAHLGYHVDLFEAAPQLAPVVRGFWRDSWYFDTGFHYAGGLGEGGILRRIFRYLGIIDALQVVELSPQGFDVLRFQDGEEFIFPVGISELRHKLTERFPADAKGLHSFFRCLEQVCHNLPLLSFDPRGQVTSEVLKALYRSLQSVIEEHVRDVRLRRLLSLHCMLHGVPANKVSLAFHAGVVGLYYQGAHTVRGGGERLVKVLETALRKLGVKIHCGVPVKAVELKEDRCFCGLSLQDGRSFTGQSCIVTLHPHVLPELLPERALRPIYSQRLKSLPATQSACCLFGYPKGALPQLKGRNMYLDFDACGEQAPIYLTRGSGEDHSGVVAICPESNTDWNTPDYQERKKKRLAELQRAIERHSPDLAQGICWVDGGTPRTFQRYANAPVAGLYGIAHYLDQMNPQPRTRVKGLFLAGQAVVAPGLLGTALSAFWACQELCGDNRLREELLACQ